MQFRNRTMGFQPIPLLTRIPVTVAIRHGQDGRGTALGRIELPSVNSGTGGTTQNVTK